MSRKNMYVGLDVHKKEIEVALARREASRNNYKRFVGCLSISDDFSYGVWIHSHVQNRDHSGNLIINIVINRERKSLR